MQYIYEEDNKSALEHLGRQATFKFRALWSVRDGKGLKVNRTGSFCLQDYKVSYPTRPNSIHYHNNLESHVTIWECPNIVTKKASPMGDNQGVIYQVQISARGQVRIDTTLKAIW